MTRARIYDVRMAQFVLKIENFSLIMGPRRSQDLRSPPPFMAPAGEDFLTQNEGYCLCITEKNLYLLNSQ